MIGHLLLRVVSIIIIVIMFVCFSYFLFLFVRASDILPSLAMRLKTFSGPETGKRKRVTRKADGKLTLLVNLGEVLARKADAVGYPFQLTHFRATETSPPSQYSRTMKSRLPEPKACYVMPCYSYNTLICL